jgi:hypothetical protein
VQASSHLEGQVIMNATLAADEIRRLPAALTVVQAARLLGIGRSSAYQAVQAGTWPTRVLRMAAPSAFQPRRCWPFSESVATRCEEAIHERVSIQAVPLHRER